MWQDDTLLNFFLLIIDDDTKSKAVPLYSSAVSYNN